MRNHSDVAGIEGGVANKGEFEREKSDNLYFQEITKGQPLIRFFFFFLTTHKSLLSEGLAGSCHVAETPPSWWRVC